MSFFTDNEESYGVEVTSGSALNKGNTNSLLITLITEYNMVVFNFGTVNQSLTDPFYN